MADESGLNPFIFPLTGGLVKNQSTFSMDPGLALELENFEPDIQGGYRRINGYEKWNPNKVPFTTSDENEPVLMSAFFRGEVVAARGESIYRATDATSTLNGSITDSDTTITLTSSSGFSPTGTVKISDEEITYTGISGNDLTGCTRGANSTTATSHSDESAVSQMWTEVDSGRTNAGKYTFFRVNIAGDDFLFLADGANKPGFFDGTTVSTCSCPLTPTDPKFVVSFKNHAFLAGMSSNPQEIVFSAPYDLNTFDPAAGAGNIDIDSNITGLIVFREELYIFAEERIYKISGNSVADFILTPVTREIGCRNGFTIQEFAGDIVFLGPDGLRTVAATQRIGDVELGTISLPIQEVFQNITDPDQFDSVVIPDKTQYRLFLTNTSKDIREQTRGVIAVRKGNSYEFAEVKGIQPSCTDFNTFQGETYVLHGDFEGFVYRQEKGNTFDGNTIVGRYRSPDITAGDAGIRKTFQRVIINYAPTGFVNSDLLLRYDYESPSAPRPDAYPFDSTKVVAIYGLSNYGTATYGGQSNPLIRQPVEGSGFAVALRVVDSGVSAPYSLKGFQLEFDIGARR